MDCKNLLSFAQLIADDDEVEEFLFDEFPATICTIVRLQTGPNLSHACAWSLARGEEETSGGPKETEVPGWIGRPIAIASVRVWCGSCDHVRNSQGKQSAQIWPSAKMAVHLETIFEWDLG